MQEQFVLVQQHWERTQALTTKALKIIMVRIYNCSVIHLLVYVKKILIIQA